MITDRLESLENRYQELEDSLTDPEVIKNQDLYHKYRKEHADLAPVIQVFRRYQQVEKELAENQTLVKEETDEELKAYAREEIQVLKDQADRLEEELRLLLLPKDPLDDKNVILEIRAGTGGEEAGLFAADLFRMYTRLVERKGWKLEILSHSATGIGGLKEIIASISGDKVYSQLKYESGVHRVQRVPATESQGRIHTSAVTVAVLPEAEEVDVQINPEELRIDVFRSSGPGGQSVNTTDSAVRITHLPTGLVAQSQKERSQLQNKAQAMKVLRARLSALKARQQEEVMDKEAGDKQKIEWGSQVRSYVLHPYLMVKDHRTGVQTANAQKVLDGDIDMFIEGFLKTRPEDRDKRLKE